MEKSQTLGRFFVAISLVVFGVQHFMYGGFVAGLVPAWMPGRLFWAYFVGVAFFAAAAGILYEKMARPAATTTQLHNPGPWTSGFEVLALCGGALVLANTLPREERV